MRNNDLRRSGTDGSHSGGGTMALRHDPSALRWLIGTELGRYRRAAHLTMVEAAEASGISKPKLGHLETGRQQQDTDDITTLLTTYGVGRGDIDRLTTLAGQSNSRSWWAPWAHVVPDWVKTFVGLEGLAATEFVFEPMVIPGLLQTEDYARELTETSSFVRADQGERFVSFRVSRAARLNDSDDPLELHAVCTEAALRLAGGSPAVRRAQYAHLVQLARRPNVTMQVLRPEDGHAAGIKGQFAVLDFELARSIAYAELMDGAVYVQDQDQIQTYNMVAENLRQVALSPEKSVALIRELMRTVE